mmetsp:Transcript_56364/g.123769  ORF Transcript_56364/g.123769 Transcript_56364/m.123769 type:complete len:261 (-) Transcript_56364:1961-2743(-)
MISSVIYKEAGASVTTVSEGVQGPLRLLVLLAELLIAHQRRRRQLLWRALRPVLREGGGRFDSSSGGNNWASTIALHHELLLPRHRGTGIPHHSALIDCVQYHDLGGVRVIPDEVCVPIKAEDFSVAARHRSRRRRQGLDHRVSKSSLTAPKHPECQRIVSESACRLVCTLVMVCEAAVLLPQLPQLPVPPSAEGEERYHCAKSSYDDDNDDGDARHEHARAPTAVRAPQWRGRASGIGGGGRCGGERGDSARDGGGDYS